jgi:hypothetical protein
MKTHRVKTKVICILGVFACTINISCKKLIAIDEPINTLTTTEIFSTDATATAAMAGVYSTMINGTNGGSVNSATTIFSGGLSTSLGALSADELNSASADVYNSNHLTVLNAQASSSLWISAYNIIYKANSVIEGIELSKSPALHDQVRVELTAEAKFIRAFSYFYLTNFFGDVPMALTVDFNKTRNALRMPQQQVYQQIIADLKAAQAVLPADYAAGNGQRIIPNKSAATLLLARVYLYTRDYAGAAAQASEVISNNSLYQLEPDLNNVFATASREAVWQLAQTTADPQLKNGTPEGFIFIPLVLDHHSLAPYVLTNQLLSAFESGDKRRGNWVDSTDYSYGASSPPFSYYPHKYVIGSANADASQAPPQYYTALRLAEAYLIHAEALANGAPGGVNAAIADLNTIRGRAGLPGLAPGLSEQQVKTAVAHEWQIEYFAEWAHRWFDLRRTGKAHDALSVIPAKQPWAGDYQLLYPIPQAEITFDPFLKQNPGY